MKVIAEDLPGYQRFYDAELTSLPGVERLTSTLVMKNIKANAGPPL
ncbi:transcriptional regulator protein [Arthrobacter sp. Hiyo4]|nr:transcriptional regulator protein [Arthrobacter sp. Hiyo4]